MAPERIIAVASRAERRSTETMTPPVVERPGIMIERVTLRALVAHQAAWSDLAGRALEPNVFLDAAFAIPLFQHVGFDARPDVLLAWEEDGATTFGRLVGLFPIRVPTPSLWRGATLARGFHHPQIALGTPLLDRDRGLEAFAAMLAWLGDAHPRCAGLVLTAIPAEGPFASALRSARDLTIEPLETYRRAVLRLDGTDAADRGQPGQAWGSAVLSARRRKELRRQRRRLSEFGTLTYHSARSPQEVRRAAERFLALEYDGWKGRRGTALLATPSLATFTRTMTRLMAHEGRCRIESLELDGQPVAMGILVMAGPVAHFWKTTFDERFAALSPGVQFVLAMTEHQAADPSMTLADSCAVPDHPMIDRLWSGRMAVADLAIALRPGDARFAEATRRERIRKRLRDAAKTMLHAYRRLAERHRMPH